MPSFRRPWTRRGARLIALQRAITIMTILSNCGLFKVKGCFQPPSSLLRQDLSLRMDEDPALNCLQLARQYLGISGVNLFPG